MQVFEEITGRFIAARSTGAKKWKQVGQTNEPTKCELYIWWNIIQPFKGMEL